MGFGARGRPFQRGGRRYAAGLAGLLGPSAAFGGFGLAFGHPLRSAGPFGPSGQGGCAAQAFFFASRQIKGRSV